MAELNALDSSVETIIVDNNACSNQSFTVLNLTRFVNLKVFEVGDYSFAYVNELKLIRLLMLERVVTGKYSITGYKKNDCDNPDGSFYLRDCERLNELKMGRYSFSDFTVCEISNLASLEVIEMGELNEVGGNFCYASLELKSDDDEMK